MFIVAGIASFLERDSNVDYISGCSIVIYVANFVVLQYCGDKYMQERLRDCEYVPSYF